MFVLEALVLTFMTTPLVTTLYPPKYRVRIAKTGANFKNVADDENGRTSEAQTSRKRKRSRRHEKQSSQSGERVSGSDRRMSGGYEEDEDQRTRFTVVLDRIEHLPGAMAIAQLVNPLISGFESDVDGDEHAEADDDDGGEKVVKSEKLQLDLNEPTLGRDSPAPSITTTSSSSSTSSTRTSLLTPTINALRLIKLTDRVSAVMKSHEISTLLHTDPLLCVFRMFALLQGIDVYGEVDVVPEEEMAERVLEGGERFGAEMVVVPWVVHSASASGTGGTGVGTDGRQSQVHSQVQTPKGGVVHNPFDALFRSGGTGKEGASAPTSPEIHPHSHPHPHSHGHSLWTLAPNTSLIHSHFIRNVFARSDVDVGLYIDQSGVVGAPPFVNSVPESDIPLSAGTDPMNAMGFGLAGAGRGRGRVHMFLPFFGGPDDRLALEFVVGLCRRNERLRATVVRFRKVEASVAGGGGGTIPGAEGGGDKDKTQGDRNEEVNMTTVASVSSLSFIFLLAGADV